MRAERVFRYGTLLPVLLVLAAGCGEKPEPALDVLGPVRLNMAEAELRASLHAAGVEPRCTEAGQTTRCAWRSASSRVRLTYIAHDGRVVGAERMLLRSPGGPPAAELHGLAERRFPGAEGPDGAGSVQISETQGDGIFWTVPERVGRRMKCEDIPEGTGCVDFIVSIPALDTIKDQPSDPLADDADASQCASWVRRVLGSC